MSLINIKYIFYVFLLIPITWNNFLFANTGEINKYAIETIETNNKKINHNNDYLLGPGDSVYIKFEGVGIFDGRYNINLEGYLLLTELESFYAENLTLEELKEELTKEYSKFIKSPEIILGIASYRPVNVYIKRQVKRPGLYELNYKNRNLNNSSNISIDAPRLFNAIKLSKGITNFADLSKISVIRKNSISKRGGKIKAEINLLKLLRDGDQTQNIRLMDEDIIVIGKSNKVLKKQINEFNRSNFSPKTVNVYVSGNVKEPGSIEISQGSRLIQALYKAGGEKYWTGKINFIRLDEFGNVSKNSFSYNSKTKLKSKNNPVLMEGDIINVNKNIIGKTSEAMVKVSSPVITTLGIFNIFD